MSYHRYRKATKIPGDSDNDRSEIFQNTNMEAKTVVSHVLMCGADGFPKLQFILFNLEVGLSLTGFLGWYVH